MITIEAVLSDIEKFEKDVTMSPETRLIAIIKVIMKFISTMRSNQLLPEGEKVRLHAEKKNRKEVKK
jgi:hypothetical protein